MPKKPIIDKEMFKRSVLYNVKTLYRKTLEEATEQQIFQAVAYAVKDNIVDHWLKTQAAYDEKDPKTVYYMSMEFLMGRALGNNMINLMAYKEFSEALEELGLDINVIEDQEPDAALGNGGLGRLAACFLDSLATLGYSAYGCGIRYRYGMFKQQIRDGFQREVPDDWLRDGNPFELRRPEYTKVIKFGGNVACREEDGRLIWYQENYQSVKAVPYDLPVVGYGNGIVNTLRIWDAEPMDCFSLDSFDKGDYQKAVERYTQALTYAPGSFEGTYNLGSALCKAEMFDKAEQTMARAAADTLRTDEERAQAFYNLGNAQFLQKKYKEALESYRRSLLLDPADMEAKYNYAYTKKLLDENENQNSENNNNQQQEQDKNQQEQSQDNNQEQQDSNKEEQDGQQDPSESDQNDKNNNEGQEQPVPAGISEQEQQQMLDAIQAQEDKTQEKLKEKQGVIVRGGKNW